MAPRISFMHSVVMVLCVSPLIGNLERRCAGSEPQDVPVVRGSTLSLETRAKHVLPQRFHISSITLVDPLPHDDQPPDGAIDTSPEPSPADREPEANTALRPVIMVAGNLGIASFGTDLKPHEIRPIRRGRYSRGFPNFVFVNPAEDQQQRPVAVVFETGGSSGSTAIVGYSSDGTALWSYDPFDRRRDPGAGPKVSQSVVLNRACGQSVCAAVYEGDKRVHLVQPSGDSTVFRLLDSSTSNMLVADIDSDGNEELILGEGGRLVILDKAGKLLLRHAVAGTVTDRERLGWVGLDRVLGADGEMSDEWLLQTGSYRRNSASPPIIERRFTITHKPDNAPEPRLDIRLIDAPQHDDLRLLPANAVSLTTAAGRRAYVTVNIDHRAAGGSRALKVVLFDHTGKDVEQISFPGDDISLYSGACHRVGDDSILVGFGNKLQLFRVVDSVGHP